MRKSRASCLRATPFSHDQGAPLVCSRSASASARAATQSDVAGTGSVQLRHCCASQIHCQLQHHCLAVGPDGLLLHPQGDLPGGQPFGQQQPKKSPRPCPEPFLAAPEDAESTGRRMALLPHSMNVPPERTQDLVLLGCWPHSRCRWSSGPCHLPACRRGIEMIILPNLRYSINRNIRARITRKNKRHRFSVRYRSGMPHNALDNSLPTCANLCHPTLRLGGGRPLSLRVVWRSSRAHVRVLSDSTRKPAMADLASLHALSAVASGGTRRPKIGDPCRTRATFRCLWGGLITPVAWPAWAGVQTLRFRMYERGRKNRLTRLANRKEYYIYILYCIFG